MVGWGWGGVGGSSKLNAGAWPWRPNQDGIKYGNKVQSGRSKPGQLVSQSVVGMSGAVSGSAMRATVESPKKKEEESSSTPAKGRKPAKLVAARAAPSPDVGGPRVGHELKDHGR